NSFLVFPVSFFLTFSFGKHSSTFKVLLTSCSYSFFRNFSSLISTRIISSPICRMQEYGITYSLVGPKKPHIFPGSGTIRAWMQPVLQSNSTSSGQPRVLQEQILITSFCLSSQTRIKNPLCHNLLI